MRRLTLEKDASITGANSFNNTTCRFVMKPSEDTVRGSTRMPDRFSFNDAARAMKDKTPSLESGLARTMALYILKSDCCSAPSVCRRFALLASMSSFFLWVGSEKYVLQIDACCQPKRYKVLTFSLGYTPNRVSGPSMDLYSIVGAVASVATQTLSVGNCNQLHPA